MANPLPNALALTSVDDGSVAIASNLRNNFAAIQAAVNALRLALAGGTAGQVLQAADATDVQWATVSPITKKTTSKQVVSTLVDTDLLNGEITVPANVLGTTGTVRLTAWGDSINNTGSTVALPKFSLKLGATIYLTTPPIATTWATSSGRWGWRFVAEIQNGGAANSQWANLNGHFSLIAGATQSGWSVGEGITAVVPDMAIHQGGNSGAVDTTLAQTLALSVVLPVSNALCDVTLKGAMREIL